MPDSLIFPSISFHKQLNSQRRVVQKKMTIQKMDTPKPQNPQQKKPQQKNLNKNHK